MKKFLKGRWFPLSVAIVAVLVIALILFFCGFRITYAPDLENSWDAISACAAWVGVVASFIAIWYAIQIPKKIAKDQNRIALFEERYEAYACILLLEVFADAVDKEMFEDGKKDANGQVMSLQDKAQLYCVHFAATLGYPPRLQKGFINPESMTQALSIVKQYEKKAKMLPLLIYTTDDKANKMKQALSDIFDPLLCFVVDIVTFKFDERDTINDENRQKFIAAIRKFKCEYAFEIERELLIKTR